MKIQKRILSVLAAAVLLTLSACGMDPKKTSVAIASQPEKDGEPVVQGSLQEIPGPPKTDASKEVRGTSAYLYDEAGVFTAAERDTVLRVLTEAAGGIHFNVAVYVGGQSRTEAETRLLAQSGAACLFDTDTYRGTVYLYLDLDGEKEPYSCMLASYDAFLVFTNGEGGTEDRIGDILPVLQSWLPAEGEKPNPRKLISGLKEYCKQLVACSKKGPVSGSYYIEEGTGSYVYRSEDFLTADGSA